MLNGVKHLIPKGETLPSGQSDATFGTAPFLFRAFRPQLAKALITSALICGDESAYSTKY